MCWSVLAAAGWGFLLGFASRSPLLVATSMAAAPLTVVYGVWAAWSAPAVIGFALALLGALQASYLFGAWAAIRKRRS